MQNNFGGDPRPKKHFVRPSERRKVIANNLVGVQEAKKKKTIAQNYYYKNVAVAGGDCDNAPLSGGSKAPVQERIGGVRKMFRQRPISQQFRLKIRNDLVQQADGGVVKNRIRLRRAMNPVLPNGLVVRRNPVTIQNIRPMQQGIVTLRPANLTVAVPNKTERLEPRRHNIQAELDPNIQAEIRMIQDSHHNIDHVPIMKIPILAGGATSVSMNARFSNL